MASAGVVHDGSISSELDIAVPAAISIAIIGMSCKLPGEATCPERLWELCAEARGAWSKIPADRFNQEALYHPAGEKISTSNVRGAHFMKEDIALFDASFFNFSAEVAATMDPQIRLLLESTFESLESAGIPLEKISGTNTSVFAGQFTKDYHDNLMRDPDTLPRFHMTGNGVAMVSNRLSHFFDFRGPSLTVDTGCSTSLVALHLACQSLRSGDSEVSVVGAANVMLNPDMFNQMSSLGFLSKDGRSFSFDSRGSGYGRGEGAATIILKRLKDAQRDGDPIRAVIRETALNQDGKTPTITSPSQKAQEELMRMCYQRAGLDPLLTAYVEAHGTGTVTGDPIEAGAIRAVFAEGRPIDKPLFIGSVKSNLGHLEAASGLAGVIKVAMAFEKGFIPPNHNFDKPNKDIPFEKWGLKIPTRLEPWPISLPRRASVNSFGYGGTNGHVIMDDPNLHTQRPPSLSNGHHLTNGRSLEPAGKEVSGSWRTFKLSAKDEASAKSMISNLRSYLETVEDQDDDELLKRLAYTLNSCRSAFPWVAATPAQTKQGLIDALEPSNMPPSRVSERPRLGYVFTGQGAQWHAMGRELLSAYPVFRESVYEGDRCLTELGCAWSAVEELTRDAESSRINEPVISLPLCTILQLSLVRLLRSWGIKPTGVTGHSSGEVGAAYAANAIAFREALVAVYARGSLTEAFQKKVRKKGGMIAVGLSREDAESYLADLSSGIAVVACVNSPTSVTISGDLNAIEELESKLKNTKIFARRLKVDAAYHSPHMQPLAKDYLTSLRQNLKKDGDFDGIIFSSPTTGTRVKRAKDIDPDHWVKNMVQPVLFVDALTNMCIDTSLPKPEQRNQCVDIIVELGPHSALAGPIRQTLQLPELKGTKILYGSCLVRGNNAVESMQNLACFLLGKGYPVDLDAVNFPQIKEKLSIVHNLPSYPWNHKVRYWSEPRLNRQHRQRKHPSHDLLGSPVVGANSLNPTWRHIVRISEIPWVRDHLIQSTVVYPGAGYICMAIEAAHQLFRTSEAASSGYKLRDITIMKALVVPDSADGVEIQLSLRSCSGDKMLGSQDWQEFHVYSVSEDDTWTKHCQGSLQSLGIQHGPAFQNIHSIRSGPSRSLTKFRIADTASLMPYQYEHEHVIHPTTLDSIFQAVYSALPNAGAKQTSAMVPQSIKALFVYGEIRNVSNHFLEAHATLHRYSTQGFSSSVITTNAATSVPVLEIHGLYCQSLGNALPSEKSEDSSRLCSTMHWAQDISLIHSFELKIPLVIPSTLTETRIIADLKRAAFHFIRAALETINAADVQKLNGHYRDFYNWMLIQNKLAIFNKLETQSLVWLRSSETEQQLLFNAVKSTSVNGKMLCRIGEKIIPILRKEVTPLELMLDDELLYKYYELDVRVQRAHSQVQKLLKLYAHKNPRAEILEIGGGGGGCTQAVLEVLGGGSTGLRPQFGHYDFTDISSGFFEKARERFGDWGRMISYKKFDVESDPEDQLIKPATYDLIIACRVLHATKSMAVTMANVRKLLKPGGKLIIVEDTDVALDTQLIYGILPGWWLGQEEDRKLAPTLPLTSWNSILLQSGFSGLDVEVGDFEEEQYRSTSVMMTTAASTVPPAYYPEVIITYQGAHPPAAWLRSLKEAVMAVASSNTVVASLEDADVSGKVCIFLEMEGPVLAKPTATQYEGLKSMLVGSRGILWIARGGSIECERPELALNAGLLRTLRCEYSDKRLINLDLDSNRDLWSLADISAIADVYKKTFDYASEQSLFDLEYAERNSSIQIPRLFESPMDNAIVTEPTNPTPQIQPFYQPGRELRMEVGSPGMIDSLLFRDDPAAEEPLAENFVELKPKAFGLIFRDVMVALGQLEETRMGHECGGIVTKVGTAVKGLKVGDRVCALTRGYYANFIRLDCTSVSRIPDNMSFETAASIPMAFITAYAGLYDSAKLQKGETVLIHAGTGGVGQAAIILSQLVGAEIFVTVGTKEKREFITKTYGIQSDHIFSSRDSSFTAGVMTMTNGKGVSVVLNSLSGELLRQAWNCVARFGRFIEVGKRDIMNNNGLEMAPFMHCVSFATIDLIQLGEHRGPEVARILADLLRLMENKAIRPIEPITVYPMSEIEKAFRLMQAGKHMGKVILKPNSGDMVKVSPQRRAIKLSANASYLIIGGMGGIGRSICQRLVKHGARNLILLSRSAQSQVIGAKQFLKKLADAGCRVAVRSCDITNKPDLARVIEECEQDLPPIRGIIQAAMVLKDTVFEQMSFADYNAAVHPKVLGTWNLHQEFSDTELDFFIMLSSFVGVGGNGGQANYAAGGSFQDALARHRTANGLPAVAIDLGAVKSIGYLADHHKVADRLKRMGYKALEEDEVLRLVEAGIKDPLRKQTSCQIITGIPTGVGAEWGGAPWRHDPRFIGLKDVDASGADTQGSAKTINLKSQLKAAATLPEAVDAICSAIVRKLSEMFSIPETEVDPAAPMSRYGVDSLVAIELRNWLVSSAQGETSIFDVMQSSSLTGLASKVASKSKFIDPSVLAAQ